MGYITKKEYRKMMIVRDVLTSLYGSENVKLKSTEYGWNIMLKPSFVHVVSIDSDYIMKTEVTKILERIAEELGL